MKRKSIQKNSQGNKRAARTLTTPEVKSKRQKKEFSLNYSMELFSIIQNSKFASFKKEPVFFILNNALKLLCSRGENPALNKLENFVKDFRPDNDFLVKLAEVKVRKSYLIVKARQDYHHSNFFFILLDAVIDTAKKSQVKKNLLQPLLLKLQAEFFKTHTYGNVYNEGNLQVIELMDKFPYSKHRRKIRDPLKTPNYFLHNIINRIEHFYPEDFEHKNTERKLGLIEKILDLNELDSKNPPENYTDFLSLTHENQTPLQALIATLYFHYQADLIFKNSLVSGELANFFTGLLKIFLVRDKTSNLNKNFPPYPFYFKKMLIAHSQWGRFQPFNNYPIESINYITAITYFCLKAGNYEVMKIIFSKDWDIDYQKEFKENFFHYDIFSNTNSVVALLVPLLQLIVRLNVSLLCYLPWNLLFNRTLLDSVFQLAFANEDAREILSLITTEGKTVLNILIVTITKELARLTLKYLDLEINDSTFQAKLIENKASSLALPSYSIFSSPTTADHVNELMVLSLF